MATLMKASILAKQLKPKTSGYLYNVLRNASNKDFMPGPYPKTEEQRIAAAKKYGLHPKEYEPHGEDDSLGDYPKLPYRGTEQRDPFYPWDYPSTKSNYNEPLHYSILTMGEDRANYGEKTRFSMTAMALSFFGVMGFSAFLYLICEYYHIERFQPVSEKQYPKPGVVHYTFEPLK